MVFLIDGYNFLFRLNIQDKTLQLARDHVIAYLAREANKKIVLIFDGKQEKGLGFARKTLQGIEIIYTADGVSADAYMIEYLERQQNASAYCIVTSDKALSKEGRRLKAHTQTIEAFIRNKEKEVPLEKPLALPSCYEKRLEEIFHKRLEKEKKL